MVEIIRVSDDFLKERPETISFIGHVLLRKIILKNLKYQTRHVAAICS